MTLGGSATVGGDVLAEALDEHRRELTGYCYRMLGSGADADDAVQEVMVKAWRGWDGFEGRSSVRSWLYRIATNVCLDALRGQQRRARPMDLGPSSPPDPSLLGPKLVEQAWVLPVADEAVIAPDGDPATVAVARESLRLAFVAALQLLPPRQRAVLVLRDVLRWSAAEVAELLDTSVASVNSALQRARATLDDHRSQDRPIGPVGDDERSLVDAFVEAFEAYDIARLVTLLRDDAEQSMPPFDLWLQGADDVGAWMLGPGIGCRGSRLVPTAVNAQPAFGQYRVDPAGGWAPWALVVVEPDGDRIAELTFFLDPEALFAELGLPPRLAGDDTTSHRVAER